jgi:hypothetical protein
MSETRVDEMNVSKTFSVSYFSKRMIFFKIGFKQLYTYFLYNIVQKDTLSLKTVHTIKHFATVFLSHVIKPLYVENEL